MDDLKLSHKDPQMVTEMIQYSRNLYEEYPNEEIKKITVQRGKIIDYLWVRGNIDYLWMYFNSNVEGEIILKEFSD